MRARDTLCLKPPYDEVRLGDSKVMIVVYFDAWHLLNKRCCVGRQERYDRLACHVEALVYAWPTISMAVI